MTQSNSSIPEQKNQKTPGITHSCDISSCKHHGLIVPDEVIEVADFVIR